MNRYFKVTEIFGKEFIAATGEDLDGWAQLVGPVDNGIYVAVNEETESEIEIEISDFDELRSPEASS